MARLQYSALLSDARGKLNGSVLSRNKGGAYIRNKVTPVNPRSSYQTAQRAIVAALAKAYGSTLTAAQRTAWTAFGKTIGNLNVFGNNLILSGIACFQRINIIAMTCGGSQIDNPPTALDAVGVTGVGVIANHTGPVLTVSFAPTPLVSPQGLYVWATPVMPAGKGNFDTNFRFIKFISAAATGVSIETAWVARFGSFPAVAGGQIAVKLGVVDPTTGAVSAFAQAVTTII